MIHCVFPHGFERRAGSAPWVRPSRHKCSGAHTVSGGGKGSTGTTLRLSLQTRRLVLAPVKRRSSGIEWKVASQIRTISSEHPVTRRVPSGEKATEEAYRLCSSRERSSRPDSVSQIRTVSLGEPLAMRLPSGEKATEVTAKVCPLNECSNNPDSASQRRVEPSQDPVAMRLPSGSPVHYGRETACAVNYTFLI